MADSDRRSDKTRKISALERQLLQAAGEGREFGHPEDPARQLFPLLWEWLSRCYVGTDRIKQPATLTIRLGPQGALATLTDRDLACSLDVGCTSITEVFQVVEAALARPDCPIRAWGSKEPNLKRRKSGS